MSSDAIDEMLCQLLRAETPACMPYVSRMAVTAPYSAACVAGTCTRACCGVPARSTVSASTRATCIG